MKKCVFLFVLVFVLSAWLVPVNAAEDWSFRAGVQFWAPNWSFEKDIYSYEGDTSGAYGPTLFLGYKDFGLGLNYYTASFDVTKTWWHTEQGKEPEWKTLKSGNRRRTDSDLYFTYRFLKYFQAILGYKYLEFNKGEELTRSDEETVKFNVKTTVDGLALGLAAGYPFGATNIFAYGSFFYMPKLTGDETWEGMDYSYGADADGFNLEGGVGYMLNVLDIFRMNFKGGYRMQVFSYDFDPVDVHSVKSEDYDGVRLEILAIW